MKIYEQSGYHYHETSAIMQKGRGFDSNMPITIKCENGRLTIEPRELGVESIRATITRRERR